MTLYAKFIAGLLRLWEIFLSETEAILSSLTVQYYVLIVMFWTCMQTAKRVSACTSLLINQHSIDCSNKVGLCKDFTSRQ